MNINGKDEKGNSTKFLRNVAQIRIFYNISLKLLKDLEIKFIKKSGIKFH